MRPLRGVRSNISTDDFFMDYCQDSNAVIIYEDKLLPEILRLEDELDVLQKDYDLLQESEGNARDLLEQIYENYDSFGSCKELKKFIESAFKNDNLCYNLHNQNQMGF